MNVPQPLRDATDRGIVVRTLEYEDGSVIAVDLGDTTGEASVDVVDDTVIVVAGDQQFEFELPPEASDIAANNGVLTIKE